MGISSRRIQIHICHASLQWRNNGCDGVSDHQTDDCLLNRLFGRRSKKTSKLRVIGLCVENSPVTGELPAQRASNAENVSIWWRHHVSLLWCCTTELSLCIYWILHRISWLHSEYPVLNCVQNQCTWYQTQKTTSRLIRIIYLYIHIYSNWVGP